MKLREVRKHYKQRYVGIFNCIEKHIEDTFDFDTDVSKSSLDVTLTDVSTDKYIYLMHDGNSSYQVCYRSKNVEYAVESFSNQLNVVEFIDMLFYKL